LNSLFILDACALIALLAGEKGAEKVRDIIQDAIDEKATVKINQVNLLEVYYHIINIYDQNKANEMLKTIRKFPIEIIIGLEDSTFYEAGRIKSKHKIPLGDSIVVAECIIRKGTLVTSDHSDMEKMETAEEIMINWFR
jgi:predicted nucleic acid-binding protein